MPAPNGPDVVAAFPPDHPTRFVAMETPDRGYYVGLDMESALHPQTLLAYELNGAPLTSGCNSGHGGYCRTRRLVSGSSRAARAAGAPDRASPG